jgi:two-component system, NarL family, nitrate/nitrite response regulator NarL
MDAFAKERWCISVIDRYALSRESLGLLLSRALPATIVLELTTVNELIQGDAEVTGLNLILYSLRPPYIAGLDVLQELRKHLPKVPVIVLSDTAESNVSLVARERGAFALFHTADDTEDVLAVIRHAIAGRPGFPRDQPRLAGHNKAVHFSPRQTEVLDLLCNGLSNKEIAAILAMSDNTVRTHISAIFNILGARNRTEAVILGRDFVRA